MAIVLRQGSCFFVLCADERCMPQLGGRERQARRRRSAVDLCHVRRRPGCRRIVAPASTRGDIDLPPPGYHLSAVPAHAQGAVELPHPPPPGVPSIRRAHPRPGYRRTAASATGGIKFTLIWGSFGEGKLHRRAHPRPGYRRTAASSTGGIKITLIWVSFGEGKLHRRARRRPGCRRFAASSTGGIKFTLIWVSFGEGKLHRRARRPPMCRRFAAPASTRGDIDLPSRHGCAIDGGCYCKIMHISFLKSVDKDCGVLYN